MLQFAGLAIVLLLIGGGLVLTGGPAALKALPFELALIGGAAIGTVMLGNSPEVAREALAGFARAFRGPRWKKADYAALFTLTGGLMREARRRGFVAIEADVEVPEESPAFLAAPRILEDAAARGLICDAFRLMSMDLTDPDRADQRMMEAIDAHLDRRMKAVGALQTLADALPALGIVAAVLGIIRTMGAIDQEPAILGAMIGAALLGTFLGVFLAYGFVGPIAARYGQIVEEEARFDETIRAILKGFAGGASPALALELARTTLPPELQPETLRSADVTPISAARRPAA
ncbi:motility-associated protein [Hyphomonas sp.]|uniref:motility-associated protein n=1 Tax=Hyphomonas sp. TaxID=87 RepID=UPI00391DD290